MHLEISAKVKVYGQGVTHVFVYCMWTLPCESDLEDLVSSYK